MGLGTLPVHNGSIDRVAALQSSTMAEEHLLALALPPTKGNEASPGAMAAEAERARRRHMSRLYAELGAQLPGLPPRVRPSTFSSRHLVHSSSAMASRSHHAVQANMARILEDAIAYVGVLRATVAGLEARAVFARSARTAAPADVLVARKASCFVVRLPEAPRRRDALTRVLEVFQRHGLPVLTATVTSGGGEAVVTITTAPVLPRFLEGIRRDISSSIA